MHFWGQRMPYLTQFARTHRVLHLGPGREGSLGVSVDISRSVRPDVVADLNRPPFPFRDNSFDAAYAFSVIEHLDNFFGVFAELHRVLKPGGFVALLTPHFSDAASFIDPSHRPTSRSVPSTTSSRGLTSSRTTASIRGRATACASSS